MPLSVLVKLVLDVMLILFNGGESIVEAGALHLLLMIAHGLVMVAIGREGHMASLMATQDLLIWLLLVVVKVVILPLCTWALMPGALSMLRSGMLPTNMLGLVNVGRFPTNMIGLVHVGRSRLVPAYIASAGHSL